MKTEIEQLVVEATERIATAPTLRALEDARVSFLGQKSKMRSFSKALGKLPPEERPLAGKAIKQARESLEQLLEQRKQELADMEEEVGFDTSVPGLPPTVGTIHPISQMIFELNDAFLSLGFELYEGPEITSEQSAFDNLNFPPNHPARDSMDTYWLEDESAPGASRLCLRPHLTGASVKYMLEHEPPFRFVYPGRVYRNESVDARHERAFFQYELLVVDKKVPFSSGHLLIKTALERVFKTEIETRMRAGFFPFVEPGFEIDMRCVVCGGSGCSTCKHVGWLEVMPGGTPHPNVLRAGNIDPSQWTGFYVSMGLDRLVMMRSKIDDVRIFHRGDLRCFHNLGYSS